MSRVRVVSTGEERWLPAAVVLGRGRPGGINLTLNHLTVSGAHLDLYWSGEDWKVMDLRGKNGSWVGSRRLAQGEPFSLKAGDQLHLAELKPAFELLGDDPPAPFAEHMISGEQRGEGELGIELPEGLVRPDESGWVLVRGDAAPEPLTLIPGNPAFTAIVGPWRLENLRIAVEHTRVSPSRSLATARLQFVRDVDERQVRLRVIWEDGSVTEFPPRAEFYVLMWLARLHREGQSWVLVQRLCGRAQINPQTLSVFTSRLRRFLRDRGAADADTIVRSDGGARQLGVPIDRVEEVVA